MKLISAACRLLAAGCALFLALGVFHLPLSTHLPTPLADATQGLPGLGPSGGFVAQVLSEPPGAEVTIDGALRGTTPFFGNVLCRAGDEVVIEVKAEGYETWRRALPCRQGGTLEATARLSH